MKHIDGKTLLKAMEMIAKGEKADKIMMLTGLRPEQLKELKRRAREK
jgi:hypothetical protein